MTSALSLAQLPSQHFCSVKSRAPSLPTFLRQRSLAQLADRLQLQPAALFDDAPACPAAEGGAALQPVRSKVVDAVWRLARLSCELQDGALAAFSGNSVVWSPCRQFASQSTIPSFASTQQPWYASCIPQLCEDQPVPVLQASCWRCLGRCTHRQLPLIRMH